jgi:high-affinity K+ transport system ATPase subunit B
MFRTQRVMFAGALRGLHPERVNRRPALCMLEVAASLLSVLALRDGILGGSAVLFEVLIAVGMWGTLLAIACAITNRTA